MELHARRDLVIILALEIRKYLEDVSSTDSDIDEVLDNIDMFNKRRKISKVHNYVEITVPTLTDQDFKIHFRYIYINNIFLKIFVLKLLWSKNNLLDLNKKCNI